MRCAKAICAIICILQLSHAFAVTNCITVDENTPGSASVNIGQSFTMPADCIAGFFHSIEIEKSTSETYTGTISIYLGESINPFDRIYQQTNAMFTGTGFQSVTLEGGEGTLAYTPGGKYTYMFFGYNEDGTGPSFNYFYSTSNSYSEGTLYSEAFVSAHDISFRINSTPEDHLPVELTSFMVMESPEVTALFWSTASEINNAGFEIERKINDGDFQKIGWKKGKGTTTVYQDYHFTVFPLPGKNYYRLKQIDYDGQYKYSPVVLFHNQISYLVYPNPTSGIVMFHSLSPKAGTVSIYNHSGQLVKQKSTIAAGHLNITEQPNGIYLLRIYHGNNMVEQQIIKK